MNTLDTDVSVLKTDVSQIKVGGIGLFVVILGVAVLSDTKMNAMGKKSDAKLLAAEAKRGAEMLVMGKKTDNMFYAVRPLLLSSSHY